MCNNEYTINDGKPFAECKPISDIAHVLPVTQKEIDKIFYDYCCVVYGEDFMHGISIFSQDDQQKVEIGTAFKKISQYLNLYYKLQSMLEEAMSYYEEDRDTDAFLKLKAILYDMIATIHKDKQVNHSKKIDQANKKLENTQKELASTQKELADLKEKLKSLETTLVLQKETIKRRDEYIEQMGKRQRSTSIPIRPAFGLTPFDLDWYNR